MIRLKADATIEAKDLSEACTLLSEYFFNLERWIETDVDGLPRSLKPQAIKAYKTRDPAFWLHGDVSLDQPPEAQP